MSGRTNPHRNQGNVRAIRWGDGVPELIGTRPIPPDVTATNKDRVPPELRHEGHAIHFRVAASIPLALVILSVRIDDENGPEILMMPGDFVKMRHQTLHVRGITGCNQVAFYELRSYLDADCMVAEHSPTGLVIGPTQAAGYQVVQAGNQNTDGAGSLIELLPALPSIRPATTIVSIPGGVVQAGDIVYVWGDNPATAALGTLGDPYSLLAVDNPPAELLIPNYAGPVYIQDGNGVQRQVRGTRIAGPAV